MPDVLDPLDPAAADRLAALFLPSSARKIKRLYAGENPPPAKFAHYTSAQVALKIIGEKRLWMRSTTCMDDYKEIAHGNEMMSACYRDGLREKIIAAMEECKPGLAAETLDLFDKNYRDTLFNTFIACVSEHDEAHEDMCGRLSMWRAFAPNSTRVALVFAIPARSDATAKLALIFSPVLYFSLPQMRAEIEEVISNIHKEKEFLAGTPNEYVKSSFFLSLLAGHVAVKHPGFHEEQEWRAIHGPARWQSQIMLNQMKIEAPNGVPQRVYKLPLDGSVDSTLADIDFARVFHRLIIGPSPYAVAMEDAFIRALAQAGVEDPHARVVKSDIPIRSLL